MVTIKLNIFWPKYYTDNTLLLNHSPIGVAEFNSLVNAVTARSIQLLVYKLLPLGLLINLEAPCSKQVRSWIFP